MLAKAGHSRGRRASGPTPDEAVALARQFGYPVALKIASPDIPHKSDVGGVHLDLANDEDVRRRIRTSWPPPASMTASSRWTGSPSPPWPNPAAWRSSWAPSPTPSTAPP